MFEALGHFIYRRRLLTLVLAGLFLSASLAMLLRGGELTSGTIHGIESESAQALLEKIAGRPADTTFVALFRSTDAKPSSREFRDAMNAALAPLRVDPKVVAVDTPADEPLLADTMTNPDARVVFTLITLKGDFKEALAAYPAVRARLTSDRLVIACTGRVPYMNDLNRTLEHDLLRAEIVSLPLALLVLLAVFRTVVAAALPVGVGALSVVGGIAVILGLSHGMDMAQYTVNIASLIGLGVAIDYSLFTVSRYREELAAGKDYEAALVRAVATSGRVVAFSGLAVATGLSGLLFFRGSYLLAMGVGGTVVVALAVLFALTFLPALLAVLGPRIHALRIPLLRVDVKEGFWHRMATWVMARPLAVLIPTLAILVCMGVPFLHLRMAAADVRVLGPNVEARAAYDALRKDFPDQAATRIEVVVRFPGPAMTEDRIGALYDLSRRIAAIPHVRKIESIVDLPQVEDRDEYQRILTSPPPMYASQIQMAIKLFSNEGLTVLHVLTDLPPETDDARAIVRTIRESRGVGDGTLTVGGEVANDIDATEFLVSRTPRAVGLVVGVTVVVLFLLLGCVLLPLKAVVMNFLSIAGSFGALVWVFQDGHLFIHEPRPIEPTLPVLLFCILFGLSMDYEVLILLRIKESYLRTGDNTQAVAEGLEKTAGLITSAAAIMVAVFGAFTLASVVIIRAVGFGMAVAVALDATLVRVLLVPSTMCLFGRANWWAPRPLLALRKKLGFDTPRG